MSFHSSIGNNVNQIILIVKFNNKLYNRLNIIECRKFMSLLIIILMVKIVSIKKLVKKGQLVMLFTIQLDWRPQLTSIINKKTIQVGD